MIYRGHNATAPVQPDVSEAMRHYFWEESNAHCASPVLSGWNLTLKTAVFQVMVLHLDGQALEARLHRNALRHGPTLIDPVLLQPEIKVVRPGTMLLNNEARHAICPPL